MTLNVIDACVLVILAFFFLGVVLIVAALADCLRKIEEQLKRLEKLAQQAKAQG